MLKTLRATLTLFAIAMALAATASPASAQVSLTNLGSQVLGGLRHAAGGGQRHVDEQLHDPGWYRRSETGNGTTIVVNDGEATPAICTATARLPRPTARSDPWDRAMPPPAVSSGASAAEQHRGDHHLARHRVRRRAMAKRRRHGSRADGGLFVPGWQSGRHRHARRIPVGRCRRAGPQFHESGLRARPRRR